MTWFVPARVSTGFDALINSYGAPVGLSAASFPSNVIFSAAAQLAATPVTRTKSLVRFQPAPGTRS